MKKLMLIFVLFISFGAQAQSEKYYSAMKKNLALLDSSKTSQDFQDVAASFSRIADAEKTQWLPYYYAGLALSQMGWTDPKLDKDDNASKIIALCDKAEAIDKNAEIYALRNMAATQQMLVDPQSRWQTFGSQASGYLEAGLKLDPNNPRLYYLQAMTLLGTPEQFGGGKAVAKPVFEKSLALFKTFVVKPLYPNWGQKAAADNLAKCQ